MDARSAFYPLPNIYSRFLHAHPAGRWHSLSQEMHESPQGQLVLQCLQQPDLPGGVTGLKSGSGASRGTTDSAGAARLQLEQFCSQASFLLASAWVCHCMLLGSSLPQQLRGQTWSTSHPGHDPVGSPVLGHGCLAWKRARCLASRRIRPRESRGGLHPGGASRSIARTAAITNVQLI